MEPLSYWLLIYWILYINMPFSRGTNAGSLPFSNWSSTKRLHPKTHEKQWWQWQWYHDFLSKGASHSCDHPDLPRSGPFSVPMLGVGATSWRENDDASMMPQQKQAGGLAFWHWDHVNHWYLYSDIWKTRPVFLNTTVVVLVGKLLFNYIFDSLYNVI